MIDTVDENLLFNLHKMQDDIGNKCHSFSHQNGILKVSWKIFCNDLEPSGIYPPFQIEVTDDRNLINKSNNIVANA